MNNTPSYTDLHHLGLIKIEGVDAAKFLQGQLTCDVDSLDNGDNSLGAHCDPKGRVLSFFRLFKSQDIYFMQMPRVSASHAIACLNKYSVFFKAEVLDVSDDYAQCGFFETPTLPEDQHIMHVLLEHPTKRHLVIVPKLHDGLPTVIPCLDTGPKRNVVAFDDLMQWRIQDILSEIPVIYPETTGKFLPHRLNLPNLGAVSFDKGCYTGQEIIARTEYLGKSKHHMLALTIKTNDIITPGTPILSSTVKKIGNVVDACFNGQDDTYVLAILPKEINLSDCFIDNSNLETIR